MIELTKSKIAFLVNDGYKVNVNDYEVTFTRGNVVVEVFWGRYYDPVAKIIKLEKQCDSSNETSSYNRRFVSVYKKCLCFINSK